MKQVLKLVNEFKKMQVKAHVIRYWEAKKTVQCVKTLAAKPMSLWKERVDYSLLSSDFHMYDLTQICVYVCANTYTK